MLNLSEKIRTLRTAKNVSQEELAGYLGVTFQAVSKWENGVSMPDISLLPLIARYFDITVDELLSVRQIDRKARFAEYSRRCETLHDDGKYEECITEWKAAYHEMPNYVPVKEMLMSSYFDAGRVKYQKEIIELAADICSSDTGSYYKGQAITEAALTYHAVGNQDKAEEWADRASQLMHSQEFLYMMISDDEEELSRNFRFANRWYMKELFCMCERFRETGLCSPESRQNIYIAAARIYEAAASSGYPGSDLLANLAALWTNAAEEECRVSGDEAKIRGYLTKAVDAAMSVDASTANPLLYSEGAAPTDHGLIMRSLLEDLGRPVFGICADRDWFAGLKKRIR